MARVHNRLGKYLTRLGLEPFYQENLSRQKGCVLEIGAGTQNIRYNDEYELTRLDVKPAETIDIVADAHQIPLPDDSYDAVVAKEVLEHLYDPYRAVAEIYRVLKPGGRFVGTTCFYWPVHAAPHDYFRFTQFGLARLFGAWEDVRIRPKNGVLGVAGVHLVRLAGKRGWASRMFYPLTISLAAGCIYCDRRVKRSPDRVCSLTSGYFITAVKPVKEPASVPIADTKCWQAR